MPDTAISLVRNIESIPAKISQEEWDKVKVQIAEIHTAMTGIAGAFPQVLADIKSKGIMGLMMGGKH
jgi:hypothetical protein